MLENLQHNPKEKLCTRLFLQQRCSMLLNYYTMTRLNIYNLHDFVVFCPKFFFFFFFGCRRTLLKLVARRGAYCTTILTINQTPMGNWTPPARTSYRVIQGLFTLEELSSLSSCPEGLCPKYCIIVFIAHVYMLHAVEVRTS